MERLKFFAFSPRQVRCYACKAEGKSKLHTPHLVSTVLLALVVLILFWLTGFIDLGYPRPVMLGSYFGPTYTPIMLGVWVLVVLSMVFTPKAHRCSACGSEYLKPI